MNDVIHERTAAAPAPSGRHMRRAWLDPNEPRLARGPFTRWPRLADSALAALVFMASVIAVAASALDDDEDFTVTTITDRPAGGFVLLALAAAALMWRRRRPILVTAIGSSVLIVWAAAGYGDGQDLALVVALYSVGRYANDHRASIATVALATAVEVFGTVIDTNQRIDIAPAIILTVLPWYVGRRVRNRGDYVALLQERADRLEADQQQRARQAVADERSRIARELHDVVAHRVSMMTIQAGAAKTIARDDLDTAIEAIGDVERGGRQALGELRHLLGVLRPDTTDADDLEPQPELADIASLVDDLVLTGATVSMDAADVLDRVPVAVGLSAYRIIQESFTNIIRHAGPHPTVNLDIEDVDGELVIDITNSIIATATPALPASGYGIIGMRERAQLLGGTLVAEPQPPNTYRVHARLPIEPQST